MLNNNKFILVQCNTIAPDKTFTVANFIKALPLIPIIVSRQNSIPINLTSNEPRTILLEMFCYRYLAISRWLEYYMLNNSQLKSDLIFTEQVYYKLLAQAIHSRYQLASEIYIQDDVAPMYVPSAAHWTYWSELEHCKQMLKDAGYFTLRPNIEGGKTKDYSRFRETAAVLGDVENIPTEEINLFSTISTRSKYPRNYDNLFADRAIVLGKKDKDIRQLWKEYLEKEKSCYSYSARTKEIQTPHIDEDGKIKLFSSGRKKKKKNTPLAPTAKTETSTTTRKKKKRKVRTKKSKVKNHCSM
ncbi:MAG: hypothetical protein QNJ54_18545 [Prochloraceae cyanobacterium]|nr:hypothetical protein [Prochloraceae cyanobacterium]